MIETKETITDFARIEAEEKAARRKAEIEELMASNNLVWNISYGITLPTGEQIVVTPDAKRIRQIRRGESALTETQDPSTTNPTFLSEAAERWSSCPLRRQFSEFYGVLGEPNTNK
ncbi:MAG TPA: hypothetical protein VMR41_03670 [Patescibacteria group bacterium]|nr:hypothetical protein [Patescibacteria group bacterium]